MQIETSSPVGANNRHRGRVILTTEIEEVPFLGSASSPIVSFVLLGPRQFNIDCVI